MGLSLWQYYADRAGRVAREGLESVRTAADWEARRDRLRRQFLIGMGLDPLPARCDPRVTDYGAVAGLGYRGRRLAFQILPDCWITAGLYEPDPRPDQPCPGVLYVCGHGPLGHPDYQGHAIRWARRGYVCLIVDTIEQGDNPGEHHGLYTGARPDWIAMGYSGAGGELWNTLRALDVLAAQPGVDPERLGITGVSGGGALSLHAAIVDPRLRAVASSCGVSTPQDALAGRHLWDHCDCMYSHNCFGVDIAAYAALIAPRPALFVCSEHDLLFSPDEFRAFAERTRRIYRLLGCEERCAYRQFPGPHGERPEALAAIDGWFDAHLAGESRPPAGPFLPEQDEAALTVFNGAPPQPNRLDLLPELLSPLGSVPLPRTAAEWPAIRDAAVERLRRDVFDRIAGGDARLGLERVADSQSRGGEAGPILARRYRARPGGVEVWLNTMRPPDARPFVVLGVAGPDEDAFDLLARVGGHTAGGVIQAGFEPRGTGMTAAAPARRLALLRAGALTGLTPAMLMVRDLRRLLVERDTVEEWRQAPLILYGRGDAAVVCLYAALLEPQAVAGVVLESLPASHRAGTAPILGILRVLDLDQALGLVAPRPAALVDGPHGLRTWSARAYRRVGAAKRLIRTESLSRALDRVMDEWQRENAT